MLGCWELGLAKQAGTIPQGAFDLRPKCLTFFWERCSLRVFEWHGEAPISELRPGE